MQQYQDEIFKNWRDDDSGALFESLEFRKCKFHGCVVSNTLDPSLRSTVRNAKLVDCEQIGCGVNSAVIEDVVIDGLKSDARLGFPVSGAVFRHVVLKGKISRLLVSPEVGTILDPNPKAQRAFDEANAAFNAQTDWALDISRAEFQDADIRGVPAKLIRRDPETQFILERERAMKGGWRDIDLSETYWGTAIQLFLDSGLSDEVLIACKLRRSYQKVGDRLLLLESRGQATTF